MYKYLLIATVLLLAGCAPQYAIKNQYTPANTSTFAACSVRCEQQKSACESACQQNFNTCLVNTYERARGIYQQEMLVYEREYRDFVIELKKYNKSRYNTERKIDFLQRDLRYFNAQCAKSTDLYACDRKDRIQEDIYEIERLYPRYPSKPYKPSLEQITAKQQSFCSNDCGCGSVFDICYSNCGGSVVPYKFCIKNCD